MSNILEDMQQSVIKEAAQSGIADSLALIRARAGLERLARRGAFAFIIIYAYAVSVWGSSPNWPMISIAVGAGLVALTIPAISDYAANSPADMDNVKNNAEAMVYHLHHAAGLLIAPYQAKRWGRLALVWFVASLIGGPVALLLAFLIRFAGNWAFFVLAAIAMLVSSKRIRTLKKRERALLNHVNTMT